MRSHSSSPMPRFFNARSGLEAFLPLEPLSTLGALFPRGGPAQDPILTLAPLRAGSGKTLAFMLPAIVHINAQPFLQPYA